MRYHAILFLLAGLFGPKTFATGQEVGKGGDVIICTASTTNNLSGNYALDYVLTIGGAASEPVTNWQASLDRIEGELKKKVPELYRGFAAFNDNIFNTDFNAPYVWEASPFGIISVDDEQIAQRLPDNCLTNETFNLVQAIVRLNPDFSGAESQVFSFMPAVLEELNQDRPLQASFLFVHEWLWNLSENVDRNRRVNRYLHSQEFITDKAPQAVKKLRAMGLTLTGHRYAFDSLQEAIDQAEEGATIFLENSLYEGNVTINKRLLLKNGDGELSPVIRGEWIIQSDAVIEGLDFDLNSTFGGIKVWEGKTQIKHCRFTSGGSGIAVLVTDNAAVTVEDSKFEHLGRGITFSKSSVPSLVQGNRFNEVRAAVEGGDAPLTVENNSMSGSQIDLTSRLGSDYVIKITSNRMDHCYFDCVQVEKVKVAIEHNTFTDSSTGVRIKKSPSASVTANHFLSNKSGLVVGYMSDDDVTGTVEGNRFENNQVGIDLWIKFNLGTNVFASNGEDVD